LHILLLLIRLPTREARSAQPDIVFATPSCFQTPILAFLGLPFTLRVIYKLFHQLVVSISCPVAFFCVAAELAKQAINAIAAEIAALDAAEAARGAELDAILEAKDRAMNQASNPNADSSSALSSSSSSSTSSSAPSSSSSLDAALQEPLHADSSPRKKQRRDDAC